MFAVANHGAYKVQPSPDELELFQDKVFLGQASLAAHDCRSVAIFSCFLSHADNFLDPLVQNIRHAQESYRVSMGHHVETAIAEFASGHQPNHTIERAPCRPPCLSCSPTRAVVH